MRRRNPVRDAPRARQLRRFELGYLAYRFVRELAPIYATYAILIIERGVSPIELSVLLSAWSVAAMVFELPSGALADRVSTRWLLMCACLLKSACFLSWLLHPTFFGFMLGFVLWGLESAIRSGAEEALVYRAVNRGGHGSDFERVFGRGAAAGSAGTGLAFLVGGYLVESMGFEFVLVISIVAPFFGTVLVFTWPEISGVQRSRSQQTFGQTVMAGFGHVLSSRNLFLIVAAAVLFAPIWHGVDEYLGVFLVEKDAFDLTAVGVVYAAATGANAVAVTVAHRYVGGGLQRVLRIYGLATIMLWGAVFLPSVFAGVALVVSLGLNGLAAILLDGLIQRAANDATRATTASVKGLLQSIVGVGVFVFCGWLAGVVDWHGAMLAVCVVAATLWIASGYVLARQQSPRHTLD
ncbi:MAG: MFS transporter [Gammaproteobacteria bacterium]|nr:MFS transporter [Gammaproteobacteria bacterium]